MKADVVRQLLELNQIVIACGGGGIPVIRQEDGIYAGIEAVIDKDFSSCRLAREIQADVLLILTDVKHVYAGYGGPEQRPLTSLTPSSAAEYMEAGHFSQGSMRPKVEAAVPSPYREEPRLFVPSIRQISHWPVWPARDSFRRPPKRRVILDRLHRYRACQEQ